MKPEAASHAPSARPASRPQKSEPGADAGARRRDTETREATAKNDPVSAPAGVTVLVLGGIDVGPESDGAAVSAMRETTRQLVEGHTAVESAVAGVALLEDDPRTPAGTGAALRDDGQTIECDAAVMSGDGVFRAVAAVRGLKNPITLASRLLSDEVALLVAEGASRLARQWGLPEADLLSPRPQTELQQPVAFTQKPTSALGDPEAADAGAERGDAGRLTAGAAGAPGFERPDLEGGIQELKPEAAAQPPAAGPLSAQEHGQSGRGPVPLERLGGAVAVVVRDASGKFAAAASTGGPPGVRVGRVTEVAFEGGAIFAGKEGAVAVSGASGELAGRRLARDIYRKLRIVRVPDIAARWGTSRIHQPAAVAVLGQLGSAMAVTRPTAWANNGPSGESSSSRDPAAGVTHSQTVTKPAPVAAQPHGVGEPPATGHTRPAEAPGATTGAPRPEGEAP